MNVQNPWEEKNGSNLNLLQKFLVFILGVIAFVNAEAEVFNGYDYPKPATKLCPDGSVREFCEAPKVCAAGYLGEYPNCYLPEPECAAGKSVEL